VWGSVSVSFNYLNYFEIRWKLFGFFQPFK